MVSRRYPPLVVLAFVLASLVINGCTPTPTAVPTQPTDTVIYDVPTPPASAAVERSTDVVATSALPPATNAATEAVPSSANGSQPRARLTIMHTNDSRGYLDPCG